MSSGEEGSSTHPHRPAQSPSNRCQVHGRTSDNSSYPFHNLSRMFNDFSLRGAGTFGSTVFLVACSALLVHFAVEIVAEDGGPLVAVSSSSTLSAPTVDSVAEVTTVKQKQVRNNVLRHGAIHRENSSLRSTRAFTRRPKALRRDRHRHSTKVDTTKLPIVLLPPVLTFRSNADVKTSENFLINVVSPPTTLPSLVTSPLRFEYENHFTKEPIARRNDQVVYNRRPFFDEKIMAMKNFGMRMQGGTRGDVRYRSTTSSPLPQENTLSDYTPPRKHFVSESKLRQIGKNQRRRFRVRTPTPPSTTAPVESLERENSLENLSFQTSAESTSTSDVGTISYNSPRSVPEEPQFLSTSSQVSDFTNTSLNDVLGYDIQRTSPRTIFSLDATGPVNSALQSTPATIVDDFYFTTNNNQETPNYEGRDFLSDSTASSPDTPSGRTDDLLSTIPEGTSSIVPRTEINVATSTSQFVEESTLNSNEKLELKDLIYPPLNILAPPFHENNFHDDQGDSFQNSTEQHYATQKDDFVTTPFPDLFDSISHLDDIHVSPYANGTDISSVEYNNTPRVETESFEPTDGPVSQQPTNGRYENCENPDCLPTTTNPPTPRNDVPVARPGVKVLSEQEGIAFITRMYENLLRVLNGGPDYYDLQEDPAIDDVDVPETSDNAIHTSETSVLVAEESGDIRNSRERAQQVHYNTIPTPHRTSRKKDVHSKNDKRNHKTGKTERKATQLCKSKLGYVADVSSGCKVFYVCTEFGVGEPMNCPNGTLFNQDYLVCDWWYNVACS